MTTSVESTTFKFKEGAIGPIPDRSITEETASKFGVESFTGGVIFPYKDANNELVAQHVRRDGKAFSWVRDKSKVNKIAELSLFGMHLWRPHPNHTVVLTEGEYDAMSVSQVQNNKWPVVSIPNGVDSAAAAVRHNLEYLSGFKDVVVCFDNDDPGRKAAKAVSELLPPGKCRIASLPYKDANEMLMKQKQAALLDCLWSAKVHRPDGVKSVSEINVDIKTQFSGVMSYPWPTITNKLLGRRPGELWTIAAGSGVGKTTFVKQMMFNDLLQGRTVGALFLEESVKDTKTDLAGFYLGKPLRKRMVVDAINEGIAAMTVTEGSVPETLNDHGFPEMSEAINLNPLNDEGIPEITDSDRKKALDWISSQPLYLYDHFGSIDTEVLLNKIRYMITSLGCTVIYLDHISIVISGQDNTNERQAIDKLMTDLRSIVENTQANMAVVSHLRKKDGKSHEEGGTISSDDLRGSGSIKQLSDGVLGLERNQQGESDSGKDISTVRVLKDRFGGFTGVAGHLSYSSQTGIMTECDAPAPERGDSNDSTDLFD